MAHTWVIINDIPFDSLFGTKGPDVAKVEEECFDLHPKKPDRWIGQKTGRLLIKDKKLKNTGSGTGFASYRLEPKPK